MSMVTQFPARDYGPDLRFRAMFEGAPVGLGICQLDGRILEANPALARMLGYSQRELTGPFADKLELGPQFYPQSHYGFEIERRYRRKDGSELWGHLTVSIACDAGRRPAFLIAMLADATERRRVEEHLREAEKMEVIGRLAGGIAHDFNNLLTGILLYCDLLSTRLETSGDENGDAATRASENGRLRSELCQHVDEVRSAGEQGAALTQQLLAIARKQAAEPRPVAINQIVASTENLLRRLIGERIELVVVRDPVLDSDGGIVLADPMQLRQILLNLVLNARDAMPRGGKIRLITRTAEFTEAQSLGEFGSGKTRHAVSLTVEDNGCGMDAETRARLFEPFFTTKNPGQGTGLGLATVERVVSAAGGKIEVESEPGRGTSIAVFLPAVESAIGTSSLGTSRIGEFSTAESSDEASASRAGPPALNP
jgi:two-component system cell cycle sensor histidine kinase/response regulator CckA